MKRISSALLLCFAMVWLAGCPKSETKSADGITPSTTANKNGTDTVIGIYGDTSGSTATWGVSTREGAMLALDELTNQTINGKKIRYQMEDDRGEAAQAQSVVTKLINNDGAVAIIGEVASKRSLAGGAICQKAGIPMVSPASTNVEVTKLGDCIFRVCYIDPFQGSVLATFAFNDLHAKTAALFINQSEDYSTGLAAAFEEKFKSLGGKIVAKSTYTKGEQDFRPGLSAIKAANPEVVMIPAYYQEIGTIAKQGREVGITAKYLGGDGWEPAEKATAGAGGNALEGAFFTNHYAVDQPDSTAKAFVAKFKKKYHHDPDAIAALGYDSANIIFQAMIRAKANDPKLIKDEIAKTTNFKGVAGNITLDKDRNAKKSVIIVQIVGSHSKYHSTVNP